jgi:hypothetical protein
MLVESVSLSLYNAVLLAHAVITNLTKKRQGWMDKEFSGQFRILYILFLKNNFRIYDSTVLYVYFSCVTN